MKTKQWLALGAVACLLISLTGCRRGPDPRNATFLNLHGTQPTVLPDTTAPGTVPSQSVPEPTGQRSGVTLEFTRHLKEGKLLCTVTDAQAVTREQDYALTADCFTHDARLVVNHADGSETAYRYPDFIGSDGSYVEGGYLILVDMTVTSQDAVSYTTEDLDENGNPLGLYEDPYIFRADLFFTLADLSEVKDGPYYWYSDVEYFSARGRQAEHSMAYRLEPGESISFTLGFLLGNKLDASPRDLTQLYLCDSMGNPDSTFIDLGMGGT